MDWTAFIEALLSTQTPFLPDPLVMHWGRRLCWGIVLASLAVWLARRWPPRVQWGLSGVLLVWSLWPGPASPAHWLGLAFQAPSLTTALICLVWAGTRLTPAAAWRELDREQALALHRAGWAGMALGWLLLLDTFALFPGSLYSAGFSPAAVGLAAMAAGLPWVVFGPRHPARAVSMLLGAVVMIFVLLRLPTGNLWDALLDPWLWLALHLLWLFRGARRFNAARRGSAAIRA